MVPAPALRLPQQSRKPLPPPPAVHKTEVKTLIKKPDAAGAKPAVAAERGGEESSAAELRRTRSSPLVRKIASEHGIDIKQLEGTGMSGRVTKNDILSFIESGTPETPSAP